jgi:hypothetical protein
MRLAKSIQRTFSPRTILDPTVSLYIKTTNDLDDKALNIWKRLLDGAKPYDMKTSLAKDNTQKQYQ